MPSNDAADMNPTVVAPVPTRVLRGKRAAVKVVQAFLDCLAVVLSWVVAVTVTPGVGFAVWLGHSTAVWDYAAISLAWLLSLSFVELYDVRQWRGVTSVLGRCVVALVIATVTAYGALELVTNIPDMVRTALFIGGPVFAVLATATRIVHHRVLPDHLVARRFLLLGTCEGVRELVDAIRREDRRTAELVAIATAGPCEGEAEDLGRVIPAEDVLAVVEVEGVTHVVLCHGQRVPESFARALSACAVGGRRIVSLNEAYEVVTRRAAIFNLKDSDWLAGVRWVERNTYATRVKRVLDFLVALVLAPICLPLLAVLGVAVKLSSPGPVFFRQKRVGLGGRVFTLAKLRTMRVPDPSLPPNDPANSDAARVTRLGRFLRFSRLDEIPQLLHVLAGQMSLVGPRPEQPWLVEKYCAEIPLFGQRHIVRPGITGWAQVHQSYEESLANVQEKLQYDLYYISRLSLRLDVLIVVRTLDAVLFGRRRERARKGASGG